MAGISSNATENIFCADSSSVDPEAAILDAKFVENLRIEEGTNERIGADCQMPILLVRCRDHIFFKIMHNMHCKISIIITFSMLMQYTLFQKYVIKEFHIISFRKSEEKIWLG